MIYSKKALAALDRLEQVSPGAAALIEEAASLLDAHPFLGQRVDDDLRELVISRGKTGYIALYGYDDAQDEAVVVSVRHQREAGYLAD